MAHGVLDLCENELEAEALVIRLTLALQDWLGSPLEILTVVTRQAQAGAIAAAAAWGLLRSVRLEHPELSIRLLDRDDHPRSQEQLPRLLDMALPPEAVLLQGELHSLDMESADPA